MDLIHNLLGTIEQYMLVYGYWTVFFGVMLENAGLPFRARRSCSSRVIFRRPTT